jgi:hypothetical protein
MKRISVSDNSLEPKLKAITINYNTKRRLDQPNFLTRQSHRPKDVLSTTQVPMPVSVVAKKNCYFRLDNPLKFHFSLRTSTRKLFICKDHACSETRVSWMNVEFVNWCYSHFPPVNLTSHLFTITELPYTILTTVDRLTTGVIILINSPHPLHIQSPQPPS